MCQVPFAAEKVWEDEEGANRGGKLISAAPNTPTRRKPALVFHSCTRNAGFQPLIVCGERAEHQAAS